MKNTNVRMVCVAIVGIILLLVTCYIMKPGLPSWKPLPSNPSEVGFSDTLNPYIQKVIRQYQRQAPILPLNYKEDPKSLGVSRDLYYRGKKIADGDPQRRAYCIGFVFEIYMQAQNEVPFSRLFRFKVGNGDQDVFRVFRRLFYGTNSKRTFVEALVTYNLGVKVSRYEDAMPGDLVQFWRTKGESGHSGIFQGWTYDKKGVIDGINLYQVSFDTGENTIGHYRISTEVAGSVDPAQTYIVRPVIRK